MMFYFYRIHLLVLCFFCFKANAVCDFAILPEIATTMLAEQQAVKSCYLIIKNQRKYGPFLLREEGDSYCNCMNDSSRGITRAAEKEVLSDISIKKQLDEIPSKIEKKQGEVLRNELLNTLSRMNRLDNFLKRGLLEESDLSDVRNCSLNNVLDFINTEKMNSTCQNMNLNNGKVFKDRLNIIFPEGLENFKKNISDMGNTLAKNVKGKNSCLTYQNYLEFSSPPNTNADLYNHFFDMDWRDFRNSMDKNIAIFNNTKESNIPDGKEFLYELGKKATKAIKSDSIFEMALRNEKFYKKVQDFIRKKTNKEDFDNSNVLDLLPNNAELIKELAVTSGGECSQVVKNSNKQKDSGLKMSLQKYLCYPKLPPLNQYSLENIVKKSDFNPYKKKEEVELITNMYSKKAICESDYKKSNNSDSYYSNTDEFISPLSEVDITSPDNFLKGYNDFSSMYCKYAPKACQDQKTAMEDSGCFSSLFMNNSVLMRFTHKCLNIYGRENLDSKYDIFDVFDTRVGDGELLNKLGMNAKLMDEKFKGNDCENWFDFALDLRKNTTDSIKINLLKTKNFKIPDKYNGKMFRFLISSEGKAELEKAGKLFPEYKLPNYIMRDAVASTIRSKNSPLFSDYFINGSAEDSEKLAAFSARSKSDNPGNGSLPELPVPSIHLAKDTKAVTTDKTSSSSLTSASFSGIPYSRKFDNKGPKIAYTESSSIAQTSSISSENKESSQSISSLEDLVSMPKSEMPTRLIASAAPAEKAPESPTVPQPKAEIAPEKKSKPQDLNIGLITQAPTTNHEISDFKFTLSSGGSTSSTSSDNSISSTQSADEYKKTEQIRQIKELQDKIDKVKEKIAEIKKFKEDDASSRFDDELAKISREKKRLTDEIARAKAESNDFRSHNDNLGSEDRFLDPRSASANPETDTRAFNNGYDRGEEFNQEKARNQIDDGSKNFDPEQVNKAKAVAAGGSGARDSEKNPGSSSSSVSLKGVRGGPGKERGGSGQNLGGDRDVGITDPETSIALKCGKGPILKCVFPNSYFTDEKLKNRLYTIIANLKLEGRKFQGLEKIRKSRSQMKVGENYKVTYYLYTYDLILNDKMREVTNEEREVIFKDIKKNRGDPAFKSKLIQYRKMTKIVPPKAILNDEEALSAIKRTITKEDYEALQD